MTSPHNRHALDRVGQRAAGRRRILSATAATAAGGAALALTFGTVFAQGAAADTAAKSPQPPATDQWVAPAALQQAPAPSPAAPAPTSAAAKPTPAPAPKKKAVVATPSPTPPPAAPAAASEDSEPAASTGAS